MIVVVFAVVAVMMTVLKDLMVSVFCFYFDFLMKQLQLLVLPVHPGGFEIFVFLGSSNRDHERL